MGIKLQNSESCREAMGHAMKVENFQENTCLLYALK